MCKVKTREDIARKKAIMEKEKQFDLQDYLNTIKGRKETTKQRADKTVWDRRFLHKKAIKGDKYASDKSVRNFERNVL